MTKLRTFVVRLLMLSKLQNINIHLFVLNASGVLLNERLLNFSKLKNFFKIEGFTVKKNAIVREEKAMDRMCIERRKLQDELLRLQSNYSSKADPSIRSLELEQQLSIQQKLDYVQEEILKSQKAIVELDDEQVLNNFELLPRLGQVQPLCFFYLSRYVLSRHHVEFLL